MTTLRAGRVGGAPPSAAPPSAGPPPGGAVPPLTAAAALDLALGDPDDPTNPCGLAAAVARDAVGVRPEALADRCRSVGLGLAFVPRASGGTLDTFDGTLALARVASRRDAAVMPATMFSVTATTCVLLEGSPAQVDRVLEVLRAGRAVGFALSEPGFGSDLLGNEVTLTGEPGRRVLRGVKWLVGGGDRADLLLVVARTGRRGPGAFTAVLVDPARVPPGSLLRRDSRPTGLTGTALSTIELRDVPVDEADLVGPVGHGLATAMRGMQVVRMLSTAANLGCTDTAVRTVLTAIAGMERGGGPVVGRPVVRRELGRLAGALIALDATAVTTARSAHVEPAALGLASAVAKRVATELSRDVMDRCGDLAASRGVLADGAGALLEKLRRDLEVVRHIDTTPVATLRQLALQLAGCAGADGAPADPRTFDLAAPLPPFRPERLDLATRYDPVPAALRAALPAVRAWLEEADPEAAALVGRLVDDLDAVTGALRAARTDRSGDGDLAGLDAAARYAELHAAASCVLVWAAGRERSLWGRPAGATDGLRTALAYLVDDRAGRHVPAAVWDPGAQLLLDLHTRGLLFAAHPLPPVPAVPSADAGPTPGSTR